MTNGILCAKCLSFATHTIELVVQGLRMEQELCDLHLGELLDGARHPE